MRSRSRVLTRLALLGVLLVARGTPHTTASTSALVQAASGTLYAPGPAAVLPVEVTNVEQLGAATVLVTYDPTLVKPVSCQRSSTFDVGLCNTSIDRDGDGVADGVRFNAISLAGVTAGSTPVALANIAWEAVSVVITGTITDLGVEVETFADVDGNPLARAALGGRVTVLPPPPLKSTFLPMISNHLPAAGSGPSNPSSDR